MLGLSRFVALDLETTGLNPLKDRALEFGAVRFEGGKEVDSFSEVIAIEGAVPPEITRLTGITDADSRAGKRIEELLDPFLSFIGDAPVVGQNVEFDLGFIHAEIGRRPRGQRPKWTAGPVLDTELLGRAFFPSRQGFGLAALCRGFNVAQKNHHRAVHDARATGELLLHILAVIRRTPFGELREMLRLVEGTGLSIASLLDGLIAIGPGPLGPEKPTPLPDNRIGSWDGTADAESVDRTDEPAEVSGYFAPDGKLSRIINGFEHRKGQALMSRDVDEVLTDGGILFAEAETGTGKSFAYLLPALLHARSGGGRVVVSTHTRHLQDQLFYKDLPALNKALEGGVRAVLLKGRGNYICRRRFEALTSESDSLSIEERIALLPLVRWLVRTRTGDIGEASGFRMWQARKVWRRITADSGFCSRRVCRAAENCFLHRIRTSAQSAHVVLVNHALLFSDLAAGGGVLGEYERVIFDEAHNVESIAASHLGEEFQVSALKAVLFQLFDPKTKHGVLTRLFKLPGMYLPTPLEKGDAKTAGPLEKLGIGIERCLDATVRFGEDLSILLNPRSTKDEATGYLRRVRYKNGAEEFSAVEPAYHDLLSSLTRLEILLGDLDKQLEELEPATDRGKSDDIIGEFRRLVGEMKNLRLVLEKLMGECDQDTVFWYEIPGNPSYPVRLCCVPLNVGEILQKALYERMKSVLFTSATLTVDGKFDYLAGRLGVEEYKAVKYESPFDIRSQLFITVATFLGNPKHDPERFTRAVARLSHRLATELDAGTLTLFTSNRMLRDAYDHARRGLADADNEAEWLLLGQGLDGGRANLLDAFRRTRRSILFGLDSFREGIDVPGRSLELLIVARLPFDVPTDPIVQARSERIESNGGNPFMEYSLPETALKLRQGLGRLIRTTEDVGVAVICDPRIIQSRWGRVISDSLPVRPVEYDDFNRLFKDLRGFLRGSQHSENRHSTRK